VAPGTQQIAGRGEWLSIHAASLLLGVSTATLRRWCDAGDINAFVTPGGHRRFDRSAVLDLIPSARRLRPTMAHLGETTDGMTRAYRREVRRSVTWPASIEALTSADRAPFRACGRLLVAALVEYLDATSSRDSAERLASAECAAAAFGRVAAGVPIPLSDTVALFLRFRAPFLHELGAAARRESLGAAEATGLLEAASDAIDRLLPALVAGCEGASEQARSSVPAGRNGARPIRPELV